MHFIVLNICFKCYLFYCSYQKLLKVAKYIKKTAKFVARWKKTLLGKSEKLLNLATKLVLKMYQVLYPVENHPKVSCTVPCRTVEKRH